MKTLLLAAALPLVLFGYGVSAYKEVSVNSDRIWVMKNDGTAIYRCVDATPAGAPEAGSHKHAVVCKEATMLEE